MVANNRPYTLSNTRCCISAFCESRLETFRGAASEKHNCTVYTTATSHLVRAKMPSLETLNLASNPGMNLAAFAELAKGRLACDAFPDFEWDSHRHPQHT